MKYEEIVEIENVGEIETFDLEVDSNDHSFFANGILVSNSHSMGYGLLGQRTAFLKTHYPLQYFCAMLIHSRNCQKPLEEIKSIVNDAKFYGIKVVPPTIENVTREFEIADENTIYYGLGHAKGVGLKSHKHLDSYEDVKDIEGFLAQSISKKVPSKIVEALIKIGVLDCLKIGRQSALIQYQSLRELTDRELAFVILEFWKKRKIEEILEEIVTRGSLGKQKVCHNKRRIEKVQGIIRAIKTGNNIKDTLSYRAKSEEEVIGVALTAHRADAYVNEATHSCYEAFMETSLGEMKIVGVVDRFNIVQCKSGRHEGEDMMFLSVSDKSCSLDSIVVFPSACSEKLVEGMKDGNVVRIRFKKDRRGGFIAENVSILEKSA